MIIVNQSKNKIINFDKTKMIQAIFVEIDETIAAKNELRKFWEIVDDGENSLGFYKTEERAKEVLQEIVRYYAIANIGQVFEMPED